MLHSLNTCTHSVLEKSATEATDSNGGSSLTYHELSSIATHLDEPTFKRFMASHLQTRNQSGSLTARSESRLEALVSLTRGDSSGPNVGRKTTAITREEMIRKLRESEYNNLAAALEAGNVKKLDPAPFILELRSLHSTLL